MFDFLSPASREKERGEFLALCFFKGMLSTDTKKKKKKTSLCSSARVECGEKGGGGGERMQIADRPPFGMPINPLAFSGRPCYTTVTVVVASPEFASEPSLFCPFLHSN